VLHPEHFLPGSTFLTVYDPTSTGYKNYVAANDRCLRESLDAGSPRLAPFRHLFDNPSKFKYPNIFLVVMNAEIKFRRYLQMDPPSVPLPSDVLTLMHRTIHLVNLLYWAPVLPRSSQREVEIGNEQANLQTQGIWPDPGTSTERRSHEEIMMDSDMQKETDKVKIMPNAWTTTKRSRRFHWPAGIDRKAYGSALMSGYGMFVAFISLS
jgi:hypothetical protein